jgi:hypothetical protein
MKHFKFISIILLFLLSFLGSSEFYKYPSERSSGQAQELFLALEIPQIESYTLSMSGDLDIHFVSKNNLKNRTAGSISSILKSLYCIELVPFKILKNGLIYGMANLYQVQLHSHLHLYQLF